MRESLIQGLARLAVDELGINSDWNRGASLVVQHEVSACSAGDVGSIPGSGRPILLEKEMATHSSILAWEIPRREEPGVLQSRGSQRVRHD